MTGLYVASNPTALTAQFSLTNNMGALADTLTRLSTGYRINSAKDDPAGLIASELLKSQITGTTKAISNTQRANSMLSTADSALGQISNLLNDIKGLVVEAANEGAMSADQIRANQLQVDASINSIDRIATTTSYAGKKLLDGSMGFQTSGTDGAVVSNLKIDQANFGTADQIGVDVNVLEAAKKGTLVYNGTGVNQRTTIDVTGSSGTKSFTFGADGQFTSNSEIAKAINAASDSTGVTARVEGLPSRGTVELNGVGPNNSIVITANEEGYDNGNYTFEIVQGEVDDAFVVSEPTADKAGLVRITLQNSYTTNFQGLADTFDININNGTDSTATSSVSIQRGNTNRVFLSSSDQVASAKSQDGSKTLTIKGLGADTAAPTFDNMSKLNGWTFEVVAADDAKVGTYDDNAKVAYVLADAQTAAGTLGSMVDAVRRISGDATTVIGQIAATGGDAATPQTMAVGDRFVLDGAAAKNELVVQYRAGATNDDILKMLNNVTGVTASLASGVKGTDMIQDVTSGVSRMASAGPTRSKTTSNATAADVMDLINQKLGDKFTATLKTGASGNGKMTYMDAAVDSGSVNMDNAIRFTGMDDGPVVRMVTTDAKGEAIKNQKLSVQLINPSAADIAAGRNTKILQINLATDSQGNSITTAADIVALFDSLTPEQTGGVSASLILPDGVDPNGRTWVTDECGNISEYVDCEAAYGKGIVQPTGTVGPCEITENDLVLLGNNQTLVETAAIGRIGSSTQDRASVISGTDFYGVALGYGTGTFDNTILTLEAKAATNKGGVSIFNGVTINLKNDGTTTNTASADNVAFDEKTGTLTVTLGGVGTLDNAAKSIVAWMGVAANVQSLQSYNGAVFNTGDLDTAGFTIGGHTGTAGATAVTSATTLTGLGLGTDDQLGVLMGGGVQANTTKANTYTGDVIETRARAIVAGGTAGTDIEIFTDRVSSALNGVGFLFTTDSSQAGFNKETGDLTIFLNPETQALAAGGKLSQAVTDAVNGAIAAEWESIREHTKTTETGATVTVNTHVKTVADLTALTTGQLNFASETRAGSDIGAGTYGTRGTTVNDPALVIESIKKGTDMAGTRIVLEQDTSIDPSTADKAYVKVEYDEKTGTLTIKANAANLQNGTDGGINAAVLAAALNENTVFQGLFKASAPTSETGSAVATTDGNQRTVSFGSANTDRAVMTGGLMVQSTANQNNPPSASSNGISMYGNNDDNQRLILEATEYGSEHFVQVSVAPGSSFDTYCPLGLKMNRLAGTDVVATINGIAATGRGTNIEINTADLALSMDVANEIGQTSFSITGGGALFQLGPDVVSTQQMRLGIPSMMSTQLGGSSGFLYQLKSGGDADLRTSEHTRALADRIVNDAISSVANTRGYIGAVQKSSLEPNISVLQDSLVALTEANSLIRDADFAEESSNLTRLQLLVQAGMQTLGIANQFPQYAASLVR